MMQQAVAGSSIKTATSEKAAISIQKFQSGWSKLWHGPQCPLCNKEWCAGTGCESGPILAKLAIVVDRLRADAAEYASSFLRRYGIIKVVGVLPHTLREAKVCRKSRKKTQAAASASRLSWRFFNSEYAGSCF
ncbi:MAG: hypothetical protein HS115_18520 [Spirochaetales bacterium]|nr:hypothetical protein [Spirochaetales bacterium]